MPNDMKDLTFALRQLRKSPGFTSLAIITLALGIGVNSATFALINGVVLRSTSKPIPMEIDWLAIRLIRKTTSKRMGRPLGVDCALAKS